VETYETHLGLATAVAVGLLIGLEREQSRPDRPGSSFAGIRTYPIFALIGGLATILEPASMWLPLIALSGVIALVAISYAANVRTHHDHGVTSEASVLVTYLLGALATSRGAVEPMSTRLLLVASLGVALTFLLSSKEWFHSVAARVSRADVYATVKFLIVAVIVLPLLPNREVGPLDAINPFTVGLMVVMISGLSFVGYVAMRWLGPRRGLLLGAALGALVSSTAVTLSFAGRTKTHPELAPVAAGAIAIASGIMVARVAVLVAIVDLDLLRMTAVPLAAMAAGAMVGVALTFRRDGTVIEPSAVKNPFELGSAIKFSIVFGLILLVTKAGIVYVGAKGFYLASAFGGITDVDAVTLSAAKLVREGLSTNVATIAIVIAAAVNTLSKIGLAATGGTALLRRVSVTGGLIIVAGGVALAVTALV
jgi:uncharacterized membrane protein (DUF4010 family)